MRELPSELAQDIRSPKLVSALSLGLVLGVLVVVVEVSFAAMLFSGPMGGFATRGAGLTLFGAFVLCGWLALRSSFRSAIAIPQDSPVAVLAGVTAATGTALAATPEAAFATCVVLVGVATMACGLFFACIGWLRLSHFFRFLPFPVIGGFLAGTGWLLSLGSVGVMCGVSPGPDTLGDLFVSMALWKWVPGVAYAVMLYVVTARWSHYLILPGSLILAMLLFHATMPLAGLDFAEAARQGFFLTGLPDSGLFPAFTPGDLAQVRWDMVLANLPSMGAVVLVTLMALLLNCSGLELASGVDLDLNREFRATGGALLLAGVGGSSPGTPTLSLSLMGQVTGAYTRLTGLACALVVGAVLFAGGGLLAYFPKPVLGGLLLFLGMGILSNWLVAMRRKLPRTDYAILIGIFLTIAMVGFLEGVGLGLVLTVVVFVIRFSRIDVIGRRFSLCDSASRKKRTVLHRTILDDLGERMQGYGLSGYLFFGSASSMGERLKENLGADPAPWCVLLDFTGVSGIDVSAFNVVLRYFQAARGAGVRVLLAAPPELFMDMLGRALSADELSNVRAFAELDQALEACEDHLLALYDEQAEGQRTKDELFDRSVDDVMAHLDAQARFEELVERLAPWLAECRFAEGEALMVYGETPPGLQLLTWGAATAFDREQGRRLAQWAPGDVLQPGAAFGECPATQHVVADAACRTMLLTPKERSRLEREEPALAMELDRFVILAQNTTHKPR